MNGEWSDGAGGDWSEDSGGTHSGHAHKPAGRPNVLAADQATLNALYELGLRGVSFAAAARALCVSPRTLRSFFGRAHLAKSAFEGGAWQRRQDRMDAYLEPDDEFVERPAARQPPRHSQKHHRGTGGRGTRSRGGGDNTCPACNRLYDNEDTIRLSAAEVAGARQRLENLIHRRLAAREAEEDEQRLAQAEREDRQEEAGVSVSIMEEKTIVEEARPTA